ncbi:MAG TPA: PQQ-dependent sugar dehydrogenase [Chloroflexia bacterium]|nr:PQQ-dependent sugar dehydrogenase [Chloroflexia bacterium]
MAVNPRFVRWTLILAIVVLIALNYNAILTFVTRPFGISVDATLGGQVTAVVPQGFRVNVFASDLKGPRLMAVGPDGTVFVAEQAGGRVSALPDKNQDGQADEQITVAEGLAGPNSVHVYSGTLIVGEHTRVSQIVLGPDHKGTERKTLIPDLPNDGVHHTKTALVGPDGKLYVSMGSSCNVCTEGDERRAAISVYNIDGTEGRIFTKGTRNAVGLALNPWTDEVWASNNGRDLMGDDTPPETIYALADGADAGWPRCHAGSIADPEFGGQDACKDVIQPAAQMQAHMAPLGITFYKDGPFPAPYNDSLYIALHGSWNRSVKVGYKVMRVPLKDGAVAGEPQDFMTGFLRGDNDVLGRPAGVVVAADGSLLVSDDKAGFIYRVAWAGKP